MQAIVMHQMGIFFMVFVVGLFAAKRGVIGKEGLPQIANVLTKLLMPVWIFCTAYYNNSWELIRDNSRILLLSIGAYLLLAVSSKLLAAVLGLKKDRERAFRLAFTFGNLGMVGTPLILYIYPETGGLFMSLFVIADQVLLWTYGVWLATDTERKVRFSAKSLINPNILSIFLGLLCAALGVRLPKIVTDIMDTVRNGFPGLSMLYLGALFYYSDWAEALRHKDLYVGILFKMILIPVAVGKLLLLTSLPEWTVYSTALTIALPTMTIVPILSSMYGREGAYTSGITVVTLAAGIFTLPIVAALIS